MKNKRILIFGGSFDPPHKYHAIILKKSIKTIKPQLTIIFPAYLSPFKTSHTVSYKHRKKMIKLLLNKYRIKSAIIDDFEYKNEKKTYTFEVVKYIKKKHKNSKIYFLLGSDSFNKIELWKKSETLRKNIIFVIAKRKNYKIDKTILKKYKTVILSGEFKDISSTNIRKNMFKLNYSELDNVIKDYIFKKNLYFTNIVKILKKILTPQRFNHTIDTTKLAVELAYIHKYDINKTFLASILHDCAKDMPLKKQVDLLKKYKLKIKKLHLIINKFPQILHQWTGMVIAQQKFKIKDKDILSSISKHSTANKKMSILDMIIYVSDFASYDRRFDLAKKVRKIAFKDIKKAFILVKKYKIEYIRKNNRFIYE